MSDVMQFTEEDMLYEAMDYFAYYSSFNGLNLSSLDPVTFSIDLDLGKYLLRMEQGRHMRALHTFFRGDRHGSLRLKADVIETKTPNIGRTGFVTTGYSYNLTNVEVSDIIQDIEGYGRNPFHVKQLKEQFKMLKSMFEDEVWDIGQRARKYYKETQDANN